MIRGHNSTPTPVWEPLRVALAWLVTAGDDKFVRWVRAAPLLDAPYNLAGCLAEEMTEVGCILTSPFHHRGPRLAVLARPYNGRLQQVAAHFEDDWLQRLEDLQDSEIPQDWLPRDTHRTKIFKFAGLQGFLERRIDEAWVDLRRRMATGALRARGAAVDRGVEGPAGRLSAK